MKKILKFEKIILIVLIFAFTFLSISCGYKPTIDTDIDFSNKTYVALGDSITYGVDGMADGKRMNNPYPKLVQKELGLKSSVNYGISGSTLSVGVDCYEPMSIRFTDMCDADIVSVLGGVNDFLRNVPLGQIEDTENNTIFGSLNILCSGLCAKYPEAFIFFMTPFKLINQNCNSVGYTLENVSDAIKAVCSKHSIPVLDLYNFGKYELEAVKSQSDKLHPSQNFFKEYAAPQIAQFIADNFENEILDVLK